MRRVQILFTLFLVVVGTSYGYDQRLIYVLEQLRHCFFDEKTAVVGGSAVGESGRPHEFYLLYPYVQSLASCEDLNAMLKDRNPVVRIMAAKCILGRVGDPEELKRSVDVLASDSTPIYVMPGGCVAELGTVGKVVAELRRNPNYLGDLDEAGSSRARTTGR